MNNGKIIELDGLGELRQRQRDQKIVQCHGVFDVLHAGHLAYFESAKRHGSTLIVTITSDEFISKGPWRPFFNIAVRANMVAALEIVDFVVISRHPTAVPLIEAIKPDFYVKGSDYRDQEKDITRGIHEEKKAVERVGGRFVITDDEKHSSSTLINKFFNPWTQEQTRAITGINELGGLAAINEALEKLRGERVCVIGEPIIDTYSFCAPEAISSKSPSISARFLYEENYPGGSFAIANHLCDFVGHVTLLFTHGGEPELEELIQNQMDPRIEFLSFKLANVPTPRKTRYIESLRSQRMFEVTNLRSDQWSEHSCDKFLEMMKEANAQSTITILADFGHGLFEQSVLEEAGKLKGFVALNVQTNSSNYGFNPFTKHRNYSYLSIDNNELRIAYHDRFTPVIQLARKAWHEARPSKIALSLTAGPDGSFYFPRNSDQECPMPGFADWVVDSTGAGDAFFALTSLLVKSECPDLFVPFTGNVFAGLKTKIIGNKRPVSRAQLMKSLTGILS